MKLKLFFLLSSFFIFNACANAKTTPTPSKTAPPVAAPTTEVVKKEEQKKPEDSNLVISGLKRMATFNTKTSEIKYEDHTSPEDVIYVLIMKLSDANQQLNACNDKISKK